jgi:hypothetical protein
MIGLRLGLRLGLKEIRGFDCVLFDLGNDGISELIGSDCDFS